MPYRPIATALIGGSLFRIAEGRVSPFLRASFLYLGFFWGYGSSTRPGRIQLRRPFGTRNAAAAAQASTPAGRLVPAAGPSVIEPISQQRCARRHDQGTDKAAHAGAFPPRMGSH